MDEADELRREIAAEAQLDLTVIDTDPYTGDVVMAEPDAADVDLLSAARVLERWTRVAGIMDCHSSLTRAMSSPSRSSHGLSERSSDAA